MCLDFIGSKGWAVGDKAQYTPIGFEIVFPQMINYANELDLTLPLDPVFVDLLLHRRDSEIKSNRNLEYIAEGLGESWNWKKTLTRKRSNGSLFNSPATTAAALIFHSHDDECFQYLVSLLKMFKTWVPTIYPSGIYTRLCIVDTLRRLGIDRHFQFEIDTILEETYRLWQRKEEEIFADITCLALAFRLLRMKRYIVSSDELSEFEDQEHFFNTVSIQFTSVTTILELNRASKVRMHDKETVVLDKIHAWTSTFLKQQLLDDEILDTQLAEQVKCELENFGTTIDRVQNKRSIELYDLNHFQILKTAYRCPTINNENVLLLSKQDFNLSQAQYQKELKQLERWYTDCRLEKTKFGRNIISVAYFFATAIISDPQLSEARVCIAKTTILSTRVDDFFDCHSSEAEALSFVELVRKWSKQPVNTCYSEQIEILFTALYDTLNEWAENARIKQGRCVKHTLIGLWLEYLTCLMKGKSFSTDDGITLDEYMSVAWITIAFKINVNSAAHLLGVKLSDDMWTSPQCTSLCKQVSIVLRLLNDLQTYKREKGELWNQNSVALLVAQSDGANPEEEAISKMQQIIEQKKIELQQMVLQTKESMVPKEYNDLFWMTYKVACYAYIDGDGFSYTKKVIEDMNALFHEPLVLT
ncbi:hypothetical protein ACJIZ3_003701 [Penstemon smallii]|uniref:tricyclene synthase n=1 Tax=Penstemon smallii TaxID=265156 RepID=A0ABD3UCY0_9LAMI